MSSYKPDDILVVTAVASFIAYYVESITLVIGGCICSLFDVVPLKYIH